jgi:hypothetical protein
MGEIVRESALFSCNPAVEAGGNPELRARSTMLVTAATSAPPKHTSERTAFSLAESAA